MTWHKFPHCYGNSRAMWDHTVLHTTRQMWHSHLYPSKAGTRFSDPGGMRGWVDLAFSVFNMASGCCGLFVLTAAYFAGFVCTVFSRSRQHFSDWPMLAWKTRWRIVPHRLSPAVTPTLSSLLSTHQSVHGLLSFIRVCGLLNIRLERTGYVFLGLDTVACCSVFMPLPIQLMG